MAAKTIIGLVGMPAAGKTSVAEYIAEKSKASHVKTHDFIWGFLKARGVIPNEETSEMASLYIWAEYGEIPLVHWVEKQISASKAKTIIIDGLRTTEEARAFKDRYGENFHIIAVLARPDIRLERQTKRARFGALSKLEFRMRDREELRLGVGDLIANAEHYIDANPGIDKIKPHIDSLIRDIRAR
ncbi:MAG TPA: AAA family ATPase [Nanoarchaeota archaeon]|nr:AAA family ATPase [Nanoarchaeota archaeon]